MLAERHDDCRRHERPDGAAGIAADLEQGLRKPVPSAGGQRARRATTPGWKIDEPVPTSAAASSIVAKSGRIREQQQPAQREVMPTGSEYGMGRRSV